MQKFKTGDKVRRIQSTEEHGIPIGAVGIVLRYVPEANPDNEMPMVKCDWNQPENPGASIGYYVPEIDIELVDEVFSDPEMAIPIFFLQKEQEEEEVRAPKVRRREKKPC